ncbi:MAG: aminotransferase class I/II-fold pyridoxal phosphate-dependent enzyme [Desulfovibrio sp.]|nr:aminotransferase class I/II-fold pyridoxal phosphate-dependent enzyme [Desulfovibrio sp.]
MSSLNVISRMLQRKNTASGTETATSWRSRLRGHTPSVSFEDHPALGTLRMLTSAAQRFGIGDPFFKVHEGAGGHHTQIEGREYLNFSHYNYLGLNGHPAVNAAAQEALARYGTSAGASRLVAGERPVQRALEKALADLYGVEACVVFVSGHATNISAISTLFGPRDLIVHDSLIHNSVLEGIRLSGATRRSFAHNDLQQLDSLLTELRHGYERALIVVEGLYSMDGDLPDLPALQKIKSRHKAFLMVDEAHALGVLGDTGRGLAEHYGLGGDAADIWMGTLSKTLAGCGGYIAGSQALIDILKFAAPGFVYSVGLSPVLAAASLKALQIMQREPERVLLLRERASLFLSLAREAGLDVGTSQGCAVIPIIVGSSRKAISLSNQLFDAGINVQPIIHPAVEEKAARLRFFISAMHSEADIRQACRVLSQAVRGKAPGREAEDA